MACDTLSMFKGSGVAAYIQEEVDEGPTVRCVSFCNIPKTWYTSFLVEMHGCVTSLQSSADFIQTSGEARRTVSRAQRVRGRQCPYSGVGPLTLTEMMSTPVDETVFWHSVSNTTASEHPKPRCMHLRVSRTIV